MIYCLSNCNKYKLILLNACYYYREILHLVHSSLYTSFGKINRWIICFECRNRKKKRLTKTTKVLNSCGICDIVFSFRLLGDQSILFARLKIYDLYISNDVCCCTLNPSGFATQEIYDKKIKLSMKATNFRQVMRKILWRENQVMFIIIYGLVLCMLHAIRVSTHVINSNWTNRFLASVDKMGENRFKSTISSAYKFYGVSLRIQYNS